MTTRGNDPAASTGRSALAWRVQKAADALRDELLGAIIAIGVDGVVIAWNAAAENQFGYSEDEVLGRSLFDLTIPPEVHAETHRWLATVLTQGAAAFEGPRRCKSGATLFVEVSARALHLADETLFVLNERDISELNRRRWRSEAKFRGVLEAAPDAMVIVDNEGRITLVNSQTEHLFGYTRAELLGQPVELLVPLRSRQGHASYRTKYQADPRRRPMGNGLALAGRRKDGSEFPVEISLSPVHTEDGLLVTAAVRDISSRVNVEQQLKAANAELEAFTYSVSHDLRAPIRQIDGFSRILAAHLESLGDTKTQHYLRRIQEGSKHMGRLVDDLLNLSRVGRSDVHPRVVSVDALLKEVLVDMQQELAGRDIEWRIGPLPTIEYDPGLLKLVLTNLLANAVKYTRGRERAVIEVGQTQEKGEGEGAETEGRTVIFVRDNGVGFDMKYADRLFGVFQRLHSADEFEGAGVGLATVHRIVRKHGGRVWASAERDKGATFSFTVQRVLARARA